MKRELGRWGEKIASDYLMQKGYKILARNYYTRYGEIDIICQRDGILVLVEVKTRQNLHYGEPEEAVTTRKISHIRKAAAVYLNQTDVFYKEIRFDVISILLEEKRYEIKHIENAFY
ncbi:putative endonuclease [Thermosyntropha lipolytica DSM 11003]|uniref:UPF0102 protein SAMN02745221_01812 n=1 Tax=Thermosyntropha lipolytica DSM 11003 TaxID=1123382 RepID=A0A1M5QND0_9FIRM|nr:YraN family protein [Thermosyntropha lipolytica]SHH15496.1 putative endonuclease [Thermosyntropha lipolytica DSM 11003]